jgi:hypothetical protein
MEQVSSVISFLLIHLKAANGSPPSHPNEVPWQEMSTCGAMLMSGQAASLAILMRSESTEVAA